MKPLLTLTALLLTVVFTGCTALQQASANSTEKSLVAAGFQAHPVTADKQAAFARLTPYTLQRHTHKGVEIYLFPDPKKNVCFVGSTAQYAAYRKIVSVQQIQNAEEMSEMEWNSWGPGALGPGFAPAMFGGVPNRTY